MTTHPKTRVVNINREPYDVCIMRPSVFSNPFTHLPLYMTRARWKVSTRRESIERYREWVLSQPDLVARIRCELRGKRLGCCCKPPDCHGDVLVEIVESGCD